MSDVVQKLLCEVACLRNECVGLRVRILRLEDAFRSVQIACTRRGLSMLAEEEDAFPKCDGCGGHPGSEDITGCHREHGGDE